MKPETEAALEAWKTTIDLQKHFNELSMKVRGLAVTVLAALLAASGYALERNREISIGDQQVSLTGLIIFSALICWTAFYLMDRLWYHRLLAATVSHGREIENSLKAELPSIGLTSSIDDASPILGLRARHRLSIFYGFFGSLLFIGAGVAMKTGWSYYAAGALIVIVVAVLEVCSAREKENANPSSSPDEM